MSLLSVRPRILCVILPMLLGVQSLHADIALSVSVDPTAGRAPISPYIYGVNQDIPGVVTPSRRQGGNRMTGYNWENNASNAGSDYNQSSDDFLTFNAGIPTAQANVPGIVATHFHDQSLAAGTSYSLLTLPMAGYVAADKNGVVAVSEAAPSARWNAVQNNKPTALTTTPVTTDGIVYSDEFLNLLVTKYGKASTATGVKGYNLDNEPDLWSSTHPRLHPVQPTCVELVTRTVDLAKTVKRIDSSAEVFGFVSYGFGGYLNFQGATDWSTVQTQGSYAWFIDYFLDQTRIASNAAGTRLVDVLDVHNYTEDIAGGVRVLSPTTFENIDTNKGRIQAPRSFWDPTFTENSWIGQYFSSFLPFIPRIQTSINTFNPGTKLAISEYAFGGESHISGGLAQADILGIFGKTGVYFASWWPLSSNPSYIGAAFNLFLNYNGSGGKFGATKVNASTPDNTNGSVYASIEDSTASTLHLVVLNKNYDQASNVTITIAGSTAYTSARVFAFDSASATLTERAPITNISGNTFTYSLPLLTAAHFVLASGGVVTPVAPAITTQPPAVSVSVGNAASFSVVATGTAPLTYQWRKNGVAISGATSASFTIASTQLADAGTYSVVVTNAAGNATSTGALLTVTSSNVPVIGVTVSPTTASVAVGATTALTATVSPANATKNAVTWSSSAPTIATVSTSGVVTGVAAGSTTITVTTQDGGFTATSAITVTGGATTPCSNPAARTVPLVQDGIGEFCFVTSGNIAFINSWNMQLVEVNGVAVTNRWLSTLPARINGNYYIHYVGNFPWSHFEAK